VRCAADERRSARADPDGRDREEDSLALRELAARRVGTSTQRKWNVAIMKVRSTRRLGPAAARTEQSTLLFAHAGFTIVKAESIVLTVTPPNGASSSREVTDASTNLRSAVRELNAAVPFVRATVTFVNVAVTRLRATSPITNDASRILDAEVVFMGDEVRIDDATSSTLRSASSGTKFAYPLVTDAFTLLDDEFTLLTDDPRHFTDGDIQ
jgi:hypothetical protein